MCFLRDVQLHILDESPKYLLVIKTMNTKPLKDLQKSLVSSLQQTYVDLLSYFILVRITYLAFIY